jgi:hypothetical protein
LSPAETGVADRLVWKSGPEAGSATEWWTNEATLGRAPGNTFIVDDPSVSRRHAVLTRTAEGVFIEDLGSGNGTKVDGVKIEGLTRLRDGGQVMLGSVSFVFETLVTTVTAPKPKGTSSGARALRKRLLAALAVVTAVVAGAAARMVRAPAAATADDAGSRDDGPDPVWRAEALAREGRWAEAAELLSPAWSGAGDAATKERWSFVQREAGHQRKLDEAAAQLKAGTLSGIEELLSAVPDISPQAARRDALRRALGDGGRAPVQIAAARPEPSAPTKVAPEAKSPAPSRPAPPKTARVDAGPALSAWLAGDTARALQLSTDEALSARLRAFDAAWQGARSQVQGGNTAEAVRQLANVRRLAGELSQGRPSALGTEASRLFAAQSFQLTTTMKSDEELARKAARLSDAVDADPQERYRAAQAETWARCRDLYQQAYVARGPAPDEARPWFKTVCKCLPTSDEKQARACAFAKQLGDAP